MMLYDYDELYQKRETTRVDSSKMVKPYKEAGFPKLFFL
jgi:hypothetical protein